MQEKIKVKCGRCNGSGKIVKKQPNLQESKAKEKSPCTHSYVWDNSNNLHCMKRTCELCGHKD